MSTETSYQRFYVEPYKFPEIPVSLPKFATIPDYIVIEGNSGAGKTTVADIVARKINIPHIGEYGNYINFSNGESFPQFPPNGIGEVIQTNTLWTKLEFRRRAHQLSLPTQLPNKIQLMERSPLSLIAFEYAKKLQEIPFDAEHMLGLYSMLFGVGILKEPSGYVFIKVSPNVIRKRIKIKNNNPTLEFLCGDKTILAINNFMVGFLTKYIDPDNFIILDSDSLDQNELADRIIDYVNRTKKAPQPTNGINIFAQDLLTGRSSF